jgi:hypothetical protein
MRYILEVNDPAQPEEIVARLAAAVEEAQEEIVTAADQLREQGRQQERRDMVLRMLRAKFGTLPDDVIARVTAADMERLWVWAERLLSAPSLDDALGG